MAATFPAAIKVFTVFHDYTDIIFALSINECHDEIQALEKTLGANPFNGTPYTSFGGAIQDLYQNKAPANHTHVHHNLLNDTTGNDHPQYIQVNGYPGFSRPVAGVAGSAPADLVPLHQLQSFGFLNSAQIQAMVNAATASLMAGAKGGTPLVGGTTSTAWRITGGTVSGCTNGNGQITVNFDGSPPGTPNPKIIFGHCVQAFTCTKLPPQGSGGCPPYNWIEAQMTLLGASGSGATVQFSHDYSWQANMWVSFSWIVMGV
jgi:hypothetical protein